MQWPSRGFTWAQTSVGLSLRHRLNCTLLSSHAKAWTCPSALVVQDRGFSSKLLKNSENDKNLKLIWNDLLYNHALLFTEVWKRASYNEHGPHVSWPVEVQGVQDTVELDSTGRTQGHRCEQDQQSPNRLPETLMSRKDDVILKFLQQEVLGEGTLSFDYVEPSEG